MKPSSKWKVLVSPIHYTLSHTDTGSEFSWANKFFSRIQHNNYDIDFITGGASNEVRSLSNVVDLGIFNPEKIDLSVKNLLLFYIKLHWTTFIRIIRGNYSIHHHFLPFHIDRSFNLLAPFSKNFVVGPIQSKLEVTDSDLSTSDARGFKGENKLKSLVNRLLFSVIIPIASLLNRITLSSAKKIIVINESTKKYLVSKGYEEEKIAIIPPGIDIEKYADIATPRTISNKVKLLSVGYMLKRKQMHLAIETVNELVNKLNMKDVHLTIVGDGPQKASLLALAKEYGVQDYISFPGFIPNSEIQKYYADADIFLNFSKSEGFATVCLEALAAGLIIISTPVGGFVDTIKRNNNGYIIDDNDTTNSTAAIVMNLFRNRKAAEKISSEAIKTAKSYNWDSAIIPQYLEIYNSLI